ncbi:hypothetical protein FRC03_012915 [Tulasnella sp. 419]|nr:hypothetical protein FRC03_012915 [Tulasnella sp. 419]
MESERSTKQAKQCANDEGLATSSKFFAQPSVTTGRETTPPLASKRKRCDEDSAIFTPRAPRRTRPEKENEPIEIIDPVMQEPGYQSPCSIADVSSPIERMSIADDVEDHARSASPQWKVDNIQSPSQVCTPRRSPLHSRILCQETPPLVPSQKASLVLVLDTPPPNAVQDLSQSQSFGIDLRDTFRDDHDDGSDGDSSGPETPEDTQLEEHANVLAVEQDVIDLTKSDFDDIEVLADDEAQKVMNGWRTQWNHKVSSKNKLKLPLMPETLEDDTFLVTPSAETVSTPTATAPVRAALFSASRATRPSGSVAKQKNSRAPRKSTGSIPTTSKQPKARGRVSLDSKPTSSSSTLTQSLLNFRYSR